MRIGHDLTCQPRPVAIDRIAILGVARRCTHCQIWLREISAVATSSIRLSIAAAPLPPSQEAR